MSEPTPYPAVNGGSTSKQRQRPSAPFRVLPGNSAFRLLCHASRIGGVIGKSGAVIKQLQQDTAAKIRIEDSPPNTDDRVIAVIASNVINRTLTLKSQGKEDGDSSEEAVEVSAAQEALVRVFERILNVAAEADGSHLAPGGIVSSRLLVDTSLVGSVIGKGGKVIEKIKKDTGCKIRILGDKLPTCALPTDEMIEIEGDVLAIKKALVAVSRRLQDCSQADKTRLVGRPLEAVPSETLPDVRSGFPPSGGSVQQPFSTSSIDQASVGRPVSVIADVIPPMDFRTPQKEVSFRILCNGERIGGVIGKGGTIIRGLQNKTGASISVASPVTECDERLIFVSAMESPESQLSPAQNAVVLVFSRSVEAGFERGLDSASRGAPVIARLLVPSNQVGCLLGKGGSIIADMRKVTGAFIKIIGDNLPKCASENDQVVQMTGELVNVQNALHNVAGRLRNNLFSGRILNGPGRGSSSKPDISPYGRGLNPPSLGHSYSTASPSHNQHTTLTQSMDNLALSHNKDHPPSPELWKSQAVPGANPRSGQGVGRGLTSVKGGLELGSGNRSVIVTNSTVEIVVPQNVIGSVLGENGSNLTRLRQISGAKVVVHEPRPGTSDRMVVISGSSDETQAAQSLLQAFILTGKS